MAIAAPAYAQQEQHDQQEEQKAKPDEKKAQPEKPAKAGDKNAKPEEKSAQQQNKNNQQEQKNAQQQHAQPEQRGGGKRIPDDRYRANFGREHSFRVSQGDYNNHRFQYGGYWFGFAGQWPSNWLYTQDVFVVEIDGMYYLCNPMYPGVTILLDVTL